MNTAANKTSSGPGDRRQTRQDDRTAAGHPRLAEQLSQLEVLRDMSFYSEEFRNWHRATGELLAELYGQSSHPFQAFQAIIFTPLFLSCRCGDTVFAEAYRQGLAEAEALLMSCRSGS